MLVVLMLKDKLIKKSLPNRINGNYIIKENEKNYINIEGSDFGWKIKSNKNVKILKNENEAYSEVVLQKNSFFVLKFTKTGDKGFIYCSDVYDMSFTQFNVSNTNELLINNNQNSSIQYNTSIINGQNFKITAKNRSWMFECMDNSTAYINDIIVRSPQVLINGDVIYIYGLKIIYLANTFFINNPNNNISTNQNLIPVKKEKSVPFIDDEDELELEERDEDYFLRAPNIRSVIEKEVINVDAPPSEEKEDDTPIAYVIGPMLSMGMISVVTLFSALSSYTSGQKSFMAIMPSLAIAAAMLSGILIWPVLNRRYQNRKKRKKEKKRQEKYSAYIKNKRKQIDDIMVEQRKILFENYPDAKECERIIIKKDMRLFERRLDNQDFIKVRLGIGTIPLDVDIKYPEEHFTMDEDNLMEILNKLVNKSKLLDNVPISYSFANNKISAIIDENSLIKKNNFLHNLLIQLTTFHSYDELKIVFLLNKDSDIDINYVKMMPHVWNNSKTFRFVANNLDDMKEISLYLEDVLQGRIKKEDTFVNNKTKYTDYDNYYLIITDDYKNAINLQIISDLLKIEENVGFSLIFITDSINELPNECKDFISLKDSGCTIFTNELSVSHRQDFAIEKYDLANFYDATQSLNNIKMKLSKGNYLLPDSYDFLEMYNVSKIEQLNCLDRWKNNDSTLSLKSVLGIDQNCEPVYLDIHEKAHGPHGLIAGMTGSGKSEFIISFILSMAINYHPNDVNFILIDYKGGSLAGAFSNSTFGFKLPHLVGTITNLDDVEMNRSLASIQSELNRRQKIFNDARTKLDEGTIDIYKYQKLYHEGIVKEPVSHLIIISDEFAELKTQQPDFMEQLIRVARIGRSLGVHLILATQRPSGIVNEQIRSNSRFSVCLKVQDKSDSIDMIDRPDAASLKQPGRFYLQIGYNEYFTLGQAAWSGAPYIPSEKLVKRLDTSVSFISNLGKVVKRVNNIKPVLTKTEGEQLNNIIKYLSNLASSENISVDNLWLDMIPNLIYINDLRKKYQYQYIYNNIEPIIGEYDDPSNQKQNILTLPLTKEGNAIIYGSADSGKEMFLSTILYDLITSHHTSEFNSYVFDFGSESLKKYALSPQVGDVVTVDDSEKIVNFFYMIQKEIERRKKVISEASDDSVINTFPMIIIIINNYEVFKENYDKFDEVLNNITRDSIKYKVNFILTVSASNMIRQRLQQNFKIKIALQLNNDNDYRTIIDSAKKMKPSHIYGRGLIELNDITYEFQTAHICEDEKLNEYLSQTFSVLRSKETIRAKMIPILPEIVKVNHVINYMKDLTKIPVGITKQDLKVETYDFENKFLTIMTGKRLNEIARYGYGLFNMIALLPNVGITVIDKHKFYSAKQNNFSYYTQNGIIETNKKNNIIVFVGIDSLKEYAEENGDTIKNLFDCLTSHDNCVIVIMDMAQQLRPLTIEDWYKEYVNDTEGIWIGRGMADQFVIRCNQNRFENNCDINYGYVVKNGNANFIKLLEMSVDNDGI